MYPKLTKTLISMTKIHENKTYEKAHFTANLKNEIFHLKSSIKIKPVSSEPIL